FAFFFKAEDGIRDATVTGVQTCALPIYHRGVDVHELAPGVLVVRIADAHQQAGAGGRRFVHGPASPSGSTRRGRKPYSEFGRRRSEERRVGKDRRSLWPA